MAAPRALNPRLSPAAVLATAAAVYAAVSMVWRAAHGEGAIDPDVIVAAVTAVSGLIVHLRSTPIADPRDKAGRPLTPDAPLR